MELKGRLKLIADEVQVCDIVCDIGTDHAYIPIYLVMNEICTRAVAADVKTGPLKAAEDNIKNYRLENKIQTRLGNGLQPITEEEADVIVIAGMGGILIKDILAGEFKKAQKARKLILQPMNAIEVTRKWLYENGFQIVDEKLANEGEKIYNVIVARWTGEIEKVEEVHYYIGQRLIENRDPLLIKYVVKKYIKVSSILKELKNTKEDNLNIRKTSEYLKEKYSDLLKRLGVNYEN